MIASYEALLSLLEGQKAIYEELLSLSKIKQTELVKGSLEALDSLTKREEALIFQVGRFEDERFQCIKELITVKELAKDATITDVFADAPTEVKTRMREVHQRFSVTLSELDKINCENTALIQQALRILNYTMETITQDSMTTYSPDEGMVGEKKSLLLDQKI